MIPTSALRFDAGGVRAVLVQDGKVHLQPVKPGRDLGTELEIVEGLTPTSQVVTNPGERLSEGSVVKVVAAAQKGEPLPGQKSASLAQESKTIRQ